MLPRVLSGGRGVKSTNLKKWSECGRSDRFRQCRVRTARGGAMPTSAGKFELKTFNSPEEVRKFDKGKVEIVNVAGAAIGRATFEPGWKWSTCVKPIAKTNRDRKSTRLN